MKFSEMKYERPDIEKAKQVFSELTDKLSNAKSYDEANKIFLEKQKYEQFLGTQNTLSYVRHSIDTRDKFYDDEQKFWNDAMPVLNEYLQNFSMAMLKSPYKNDFISEYGDLMVTKSEMELKTFSPEIIPELQKENNLVQEYEKLLASAQIDFEGKKYTLSQLTPIKTCSDDARRLSAWKAEGKWYKEHQAKLDEQYDELVALRNEMGKKLGYDGYTQLGYYRMSRNCYTKEDVEKFRNSVVKYVVPVADSIYRRQAERLGKSYPLSYADMSIEFRSGNPKPCGNADEILEQGRQFYDELSPETSIFFRTMLDRGLLDVLSTEGKASGGYCTEIPDYKVPFIFANFNGTKGDVDVVTHEAGHAFAYWMNRDRVPSEYISPSMEGCEVHSMSMEFLSRPWAEGFFGKDTRKFLYSQLTDALTFIPYGTMVDHFQHIVFEKPELTPAERHAEWKKLTAIYMPWVALDGEIPFYSEGECWQRQHHIYSMPFYYIDYCLAQTVALEIWNLMQTDLKTAWEHYMAYLTQGGSKVFTELLKGAGLDSPFEDKCLKKVCDTAAEWLDNYNLEGIV